LLLRRLGKEAHFGDAAARYLLIGEAMRIGSLQAQAGPSREFANRIRDAVAQEQAVKGRASTRAVTARRLKIGGGLAIAASVGAAAVLLVQVQPGNRPQTTAAVSAPAAVAQAPVRAPDMGIREVVANGAGISASARSEGRLTNYVVAHSEYSLPLGRRNVLTGILAEDPDLQEAPYGAEPVSWSTR
jgi:negative regulator of sigma E activity